MKLDASTPSPDFVRVRLWALFGVFFASGVCGLIYESIWSHYLRLFVGHAAYAQTVVLVVFIGGMALGAWLVGRFVHRIRSPLTAYAIAEAVIGVVSLVFHRVFVSSTEWAYATLLPAACVADSPCIAQWLVAALLILPQSIVLGTTFPLMTSGVLRLAPANAGRHIALLYFLNSIGAAGGVLLCGFVLIGAVGLPGTLLLAGLANIAVACAAWIIVRSGPQEASVAGIVRPEESSPESFRRVLIVVAALTGLSSFIYEIIWIRMLAVVVGASTHAFELMLAAFIFGLAMGGLWVRKRIDRFPNLIHTLAIVQLLMGVAAVATLALYDGMFEVMGWLLGVLRREESGYAVYNVATHVIALAIMLPPTFLAGMTFPLIATALIHGRDGERAVGYTYAANTVGSIVGVLVAVHVALPMLGIKGGLLLGAGIDMALGVALLCIASRPRRYDRIAAWGLSATAVVVIAVVAVPVLPERMASGVYRHGRAKLEVERHLPFYREGKTSSISVIESPGYLSIATNGKPDASISSDPDKPLPDEVTMVMTALVSLAYKPEARTAAVIGFGSGLTTTTLLGSPTLERIDTIEIESQMVEGARLFGAIVAPAYSDPRSRIVLDDAKSYFARTGVRYDVIVSEPSNPWVSGVASLFTQEFYARVKGALGRNGIFVQWIHVYEFNDHLLAMILRALDAEFADYFLYAPNDGDLIIVASPNASAGSPSDAFTHWTELRPLLDRVRLSSLDDLESRRLGGKRTIRPLLQVFGEGVNSDYYPLVEHQAPKARFAGHSANGLMRTVVAGVPVLEMLTDGRSRHYVTARDPVSPPLRLTMLRSASDSAAFLSTGTFSKAMPPMLPREIGLLRAVLWDCASVPPRVSVPELMLDVAEVVNPHLPRESAMAVWQAARAAPCARQLAASDAEWLDLFEAVAARDPARMADSGTRLAKTASVKLRTHAVLVGATGLIAMGRHQEARQFLGAAAHSLSPEVQRDTTLLLLAALARDGPPQQAAAVR